MLYKMFFFLLVREITKCIVQSYETADRHDLVRCFFFFFIIICCLTSVNVDHELLYFPFIILFLILNICRPFTAVEIV